MLTTQPPTTLYELQYQRMQHSLHSSSLAQSTVTRFSSSLQDRHPKENHQIVDGTTIHSSDVDTTDFYSNHHDGQRATTSCCRTVRILQQHLAKWAVPDRHVEHVQTGHPY